MHEGDDKKAGKQILKARLYLFLVLFFDYLHRFFS